MNEPDVRLEIVRCCRQVWERRLVAGTSGNVSAKLDDGDLLVTPAQRSLRALHPSEIVRLDASGLPRSALQRPTSELQLHRLAYAARPDIRYVVHAHPTFCVVWSCAGRLFPRETVGARETLGDVAWTPYRPAGSPELAHDCAAEFARGCDVVLMERHGVSAIGATLEAAFALVDQAEEAARVAYYALAAEGSMRSAPS